MKLLTRHKLKVYIKGEPIKIHKSDDKQYILDVIDAYKVIYDPNEIEFYRNKSEVKIIDKPNIEFKDLPEWGDVSYGINSDSGYYLRNNDSGKIIRIYERLYDN